MPATIPELPVLDVRDARPVRVVGIALLPGHAHLVEHAFAIALRRAHAYLLDADGLALARLDPVTAARLRFEGLRHADDDFIFLDLHAHRSRRQVALLDYDDASPLDTAPGSLLLRGTVGQVTAVAFTLSADAPTGALLHVNEVRALPGCPTRPDALLFEGASSMTGPMLRLRQAGQDPMRLSREPVADVRRRPPVVVVASPDGHPLAQATWVRDGRPGQR